MKAMQPGSARALVIMAIVVLVAAFLVPSPAGAFCAFCLAGLLTAFPAIFARGLFRAFAAALLVSSALLAVGKYPDFKSEQDRYRQRTKSAPATSIHAADNGVKARF
jgi:hypothetical protein